MAASGSRDDLTEFYRELALLVRSDLPLPESIAAVAAGCGNRRFRKALDSVAEEVRNGTPLSAALGPHARTFPEFHRALIRSGERAGALPEALHEVAEVSRRSRAMGLDFREIMAYPLATTWFAITVMLLMMRLYLPGFGQDIQALLETPLPPFSAVLFGLADGVKHYWPAVATLYLVLFAAVVWLFSELRDARRLLQRLLGVLPGTRGVVASLDLARVCGVSSVLLRRGTPLPEVFAISAGMAQDPGLAQRLDSLRQQCEAGRSLQESADTEGLPASLALSLRHTREADLPDELDAMREHYAQQADATARRVGIVWQISAILGMGLAAGAVILAMFMPMIELYRRMSGN
jgi:type II secretory pathway component PulF